MTRFFVQDANFDSDKIVLSGDNAAHARVLRLKAGEQVVVCDGEGSEVVCAVDHYSDNTVALTVVERRNSGTEARVSVSVYIAFPKADKLEHVIQKATELGAREIVTFPTSRCVSRPDDKSLMKKLDRWQKIAVSAAEQSGRGCIPKIFVLPNYRSALERAALSDISVILYENERATTLRQALSSKEYGSVSILSGPEGGLEESEVQQAMAAGLKVCTLGTRILRCETAPLCALSAVMYDSGEF